MKNLNITSFRISFFLKLFLISYFLVFFFPYSSFPQITRLLNESDVSTTAASSYLDSILVKEDSKKIEIKENINGLLLDKANHKNCEKEGNTDIKNNKNEDSEISALDWEGRGKFSKYSPEQEIVERRSRTAKHFSLPNGNNEAVIVAHGSAFHYEENGFWKTIRRDIELNNNILYNQYRYTNTANSFHSYYSEFSDGGIKTVYKEGNIFEWLEPEVLVFDNNFNVKNNISAIKVSGNVIEDRIIYNNVYPATDVKITQTYIGRQLDMIINNSQGLLDLDENDLGLAYSEKVIVPNGWIVKTSLYSSNSDRIATISIFDNSGTEIVRYLPPYIYEQNPPKNPAIDRSKTKEEQNLGDWSHRIDTYGYYKISQNGNELTIYKIIPAEWLLAEGRTFPILVDPTISCYPWPYDCNTGSTSGTAWTQTSRVRGYNQDNGWIDFDVYSIPNNTTSVNSVTYNVYVYEANWPYWSATPVATGGSVSGFSISDWCGNTAYDVLKNDIKAEESIGYYLYRDESSGYTTGWKQHVLEGNANADCLSAINETTGDWTNYFTVGHATRDESTSYYISLDGYAESNPPYVVIDYTLSAISCGNTNLGEIYPSACSPQNANYSSGTIPYWTFYASAGTTYHFSLGANSEDSFLRLYDAANYVMLASNDDNGPFVSGTPASLSWTCTTSGYFFISASLFLCENLNNSSYLKYWSTYGTYGSGSGNTITPGCWQNQAYSNGSLYWYKFDATSGNTYHFNLCSNSEDSYIRIFNTNWDVIDSFDDDGSFCSGYSASSSWVATATQTYIVAVYQYGCNLLSNSGNMAYASIQGNPTTYTDGFLHSSVWQSASAGAFTTYQGSFDQSTPTITQGWNTLVNNSWGSESVSGGNICGAYSDLFAIKNKGYISLPPGAYTFRANSDDGNKLFASWYYEAYEDNAFKVIDDWSNHAARDKFALTTFFNNGTDNAELFLDFHFYENTGNASQSLFMKRDIDLNIPASYEQTTAGNLLASSESTFDINWFQVSLTSGVTYRFWSTNQSGGVAGLRADIFKNSDIVNPVATHHSDGGNFDITYLATSTEIYWIRVYPYYLTSAISYTLNYQAPCAPNLTVLSSNTPVTTNYYSRHYEYNHSTYYAHAVAIAPNIDDKNISLYSEGCQEGSFISSSVNGSTIVDYIVGGWQVSGTFFPTVYSSTTSVNPTTVEYDFANYVLDPTWGLTEVAGVFDATNIIELYEVTLTQGTLYNFELDVSSGDQNLGFGVGLPLTTGWVNRGSMSFNQDDNGSGLSETKNCWECSESGDYTVVIFNNKALSGTLSSNYTLRIHEALPEQPGIISGNNSVCSGTSNDYNISPVTGATSYSWEYSGGGTPSGTGTTISLVPTSSGILRVRANNDCGSSSWRELSLTVNSLPVALVLTGSTICAFPGDNGTITSATSQSGINYQLYNSTHAAVQSAKAGTDSGLTWTGLVPGAGYYVVGTNASTSCVSANSNTVDVSTNANPTASPGFSQNPICNGLSTILSANATAGSGSITTYSWSSGIAGNNASGTVSASGTYTVTVTNSNGCTVSATSPSLSIIPESVGGSVSGGTTPLCLGAGTGTMTLSGHTGSIIKWQKKLNSGNWTDITHTANTYSETPSSAGTWAYRAEVQNSSCTPVFSTENTIIVNAIPSAPTADNNGPVCTGSSLSLTASDIPGATYSWSGPDNFSSAAQNPTVNASATTNMAGMYYVTATVNGCASSAGNTTVTVNVTPFAPTADNNGPVCEGGTLSLTATTITGATYSWTGPDNFTSSAQNPTVSTNATTPMGGSYNVTASVNGCTSQAASTTATVNAAPSVPTAGTVGANCVGGQIKLTASTITGATYAWTGPDNYTSATQNPTVTNNATLQMAGLYSVVATVNGCASQAETIDIVVYEQTVAGTASANQVITSGTQPADLTLTGYLGDVEKWQYSANSNFSGATDIGSSASATLTSAQMGNLNATRYYRAVVQNGTCAASNSNIVSITVPEDVTFDGMTSDWGTAPNWNTVQTPDGSSVVTLPSNAGVVIADGTNAQALDLIVEPNATLTIEGGGSLSINRDLYILSDASGTGSFIDNSNVQINGNVYVQKYLASSNAYGWTVSTPVQSASQNIFTGHQNTYFYNALTANWSSYSSGNMEHMRGYWTKFNIDKTLEFNDALNTGEIEYTNFYRTGVNTGNFGWNFIGNPYPSPIDWAKVVTLTENGGGDNTAFITATKLNPTVYVPAADGSYLYYTDEFGNNFNGIIPSASGFWLQVYKGDSNENIDTQNPIAGAQLTFNNSVRAHAAGGSKSTAINQIKLSLTNNNFSDQAIVRLKQGTNTSFDAAHDALKMLSQNPAHPQLYSVNNDDFMALNSVSNNLTHPTALPLGFVTGADANLSINADVSSLDASVSVYLEDTELDILQDLKTNPSYSFTSTANESNDRFILHLASANVNASNAITESNTSIYTYENALYINLADEKATVSIYNVLGQEVYSSQLSNGLTKLSLNFVTGSFIVNVVSGKSVKTEKVFLR